MTQPTTIQPDDAGLIEERWREHMLARDFFKMLSYAGTAFYLEPPRGDAPGGFSVVLTALHPEELHREPGQRVARVIGWTFPLYQGAPAILDAPASEGGPHG